ncbi:hypothetical protein [Paenibacillus sp. SYP-B4298]|uniref:hypothetical protein n=1 Tax=Paenibacillus sp. SYP-B4298 TaxID=2996034 RepID=UPI0022DE415C|nr:hypothetical protein [Paenibacillus sp. SYP-B4298]
MERLKIVDRPLVLMLAVTFIAYQLTHWTLLGYAVGWLALAAIGVLLRHLRGTALYLSLVFMIVGTVSLILQQAPLAAWLQAASMNATLVTLFVFAPLFGIPVRLPEYYAALERFYERRLRSTGSLLVGTQLLTQLLGAFINVGSIPVVYYLVYVKPRAPALSSLLAAAMNRGFGGAILWSPYFAAMTLVASSLHVSWSVLLPHLLVLSLLSVAISLLVDAPKLRQASDAMPPVTNEEGLPQPDADTIRLSQTPAPPLPAERTIAAGEDKPTTSGFPPGLAAYLILAIGVILLLERLVDLPMVIITCLAASVFPLLWCMLKRELPTFRQGLTNHFRVTLGSLQKEMTLFLAAGFFSGAISGIGFGPAIPELLGQLPLPVAFSFSLLTVAAVGLTSLIGLHPIVTVTVLVTSIDPASVGLNTVSFAILLLGSWSLSNPVSPASAVNNLLAGLLKQPVFRLTRANYRFAAVMALALLLYVLLVAI